MTDKTRPRASGRRRHYASPYTNHREICDRLKQQPGQWGTVAQYAAKYVATAVSTAIAKADPRSHLSVYGPPGSCEARVTMTDDGWLVEARYTGEDAPREGEE